MERQSLTMFVEDFGASFTKFHLNLYPGGDAPFPFHPVLHRFREPDHGSPHSHPWDFVTHVLHGSYIEEVFERDLDNGIWRSKREHRTAGNAYHLKAHHIHRLVELPDGECWTIAMYADMNVPFHWYNLDTGEILP